jgi:hypothetical protein
MDFNEKVKNKYPYLEDNLVEDVVNKAKMFYFALRYPCLPNISEETHPIETFFEEQWILSACDEFIERLGFSSALAYRENGVSWSLDNAQLSATLIGLVKPIASVI